MEYRFDADEMVAGIREWVMVESPTYHREGVNRMMDLAEQAMANLGAKVERISGSDGYGDVVKARLAATDAGPGILILCHLDTVHAVGTLESVLPYRRDGDKVFGPGIYDMKGGAFIAYYAVDRLRRAGVAVPLPVTFLFIPDEEVGSPTTRDLIEAEAGKSRYVLVTEPAKDGKLITGRFAFARFWLKARGRPSHAGAALRRGRSAIKEMARQILNIEDMTNENRGFTLSVGVISGGTFVNTVPIECRAQALAVMQTQETYREICGRMLALDSIDPDAEFTVEQGPVRPLFEPSNEVLALYDTAAGIARKIGFVPGHGSFGGGSDGNFTGAMGIPTLDGLGVCGDGAHTHSEYLLYSSLEPRARLMAGLLQRLQ
jgi:glutamate carboxypeptidase